MAHHVVPYSLGGTRTVPLCSKCHGLIHGLEFRLHSHLVKRALATAKNRGVVLGRPRVPTSQPLPTEYRGMTLRQIAAASGLSKSTVKRRFDRGISVEQVMFEVAGREQEAKCENLAPKEMEANG